ncbi:MAG TPA: D-glycerate dehydrogenase [Terriglobia bacterium]|nr:D-glycerate dehydrogenase [Terriglobia bacterium]
MKPKVFVTRPLPKPVLDLLAARTELRFHHEDTSIPAAALAAACRDTEGLLAVGARVTVEVLQAAAKLRVVANAGVGVDHVDVAACTARRIAVTNAPGGVEEATADLAFALLLAAARRVVEGDRTIRQGRWQHWQWDLLWGADVHHKTLGIYGFGHIGQAMARRGRGFAMRILYYSRHRVAESVERELGAEYVDRGTLLRNSDFLSLHVPLTLETERLIQARDLALMKPSAFLINTARGRVVDEEALASALKAGKLAGAGLDVFEREPRVHPTLLEMSNVVLLPHIGSATAETRLQMARLAAENLLAALEGRRPPNLVNPEIYG